MTPASEEMEPAPLFLRPLELQPLDALEKLAVRPEGRADVGFDQQRVVHDTVIVQVEQLIAQAARGADRREGRVDRFILRLEVVGQRCQAGNRQVRPRLAHRSGPSSESR